MMSNKSPEEQFEANKEILAAEFDYIAQTAFQAQEDRARVSEFFLISFGTLLAALLTSQFGQLNLKLTYILFTVLLSAVAFLGALTIFELSRLRLAWFGSIRAMNKMKDAIIEHNPALADCFAWRTESIPPAYKKTSVGYLKALEVAIISGIAAGAAVAFTILALFGSLMIAIIAAVITAILSAYLFLLFFYKKPLSNV